MKYFFTSVLYCIISISFVSAQNFPWNNPLKIAWSSDGINFNNSTVFQDSSGVPCVIRWKGDTLIAAFQWFRQPNPSPSWDRVATKFSYDNGLTWTIPTPITFNGLPGNYQRPFDPSLTVFGKDSIRIFFSSGNGIPMGGLDSSINTYSAKSTDGIHFVFEANPRVDELMNRVIDPSVIYFNNSWHYLSPVGAPQQGAYHYVSPNGLNFMAVPAIPSDNMHNWTGNYMTENNTELRFYGCGQNIWYNFSPNGGVWNGYVNTNIHGGDPSVLKIANSNYLMIYVGEPYKTAISSTFDNNRAIHVFPNPVDDRLIIETDERLSGSEFLITDQLQRDLKSGKIIGTNTPVSLNQFSSGVYYLFIGDSKEKPFIIMKK